MVAYHFDFVIKEGSIKKIQEDNRKGKKYDIQLNDYYEISDILKTEN